LYKHKAKYIEEIKARVRALGALELEHNNYRWKILAMTYACQISFALVFQSIPPILRLIVSELKITHAQAGLLMSLFALPGVFLAIPSGIISDRFGAKKVGFASLILMIIGTFLAGLSNSFLLMALGRTVSGIGAITLVIVLPQLLSRWFMHKELGLGMGVFNTAMPLGTITSFNVLSIIGANLGWRVPIFLTTAVCAGALLIFLLLFREPAPRSREPRISVILEVSRTGKPIWFVGLTWMWFNAAFISFLTFAQDFFVAKGYEVASASFLSSIVMMGSLFLSPLIGYLVNKFGKEEGFIIIGGAVLAFLIFLVSIIISPIPMLVLIGLFVAFVPAPLFSLPSKIVKPQDLGLAFGILTTCSNMGVLAGPYLAGLAKDLTGEYTFSLYLMSLFNILQALTILLLYLLRTKTTR